MGLIANKHIDCRFRDLLGIRTCRLVGSDDDDWQAPLSLCIEFPKGPCKGEFAPLRQGDVSAMVTQPLTKLLGPIPDQRRWAQHQCFPSAWPRTLMCTQEREHGRYCSQRLT